MSPGKPDAEVLRRHLASLDQALRHLRRHQDVGREELSRNRDLRWIVERSLLVCAQNVLDIATHLVASAGLDAPDYTTALDELARMGVLEQEFAERFRGIAGFRNVLVHAYLDVDVDRLYELLTRRLDDFAEFAESVHAYITEHSD